MSDRPITGRMTAAGRRAARGGANSSRSGTEDHSSPRSALSFQTSSTSSPAVSQSLPILSNTSLPSSGTRSFDFGRPVQFTGMLPVVSRIFSSPPIFDEIFYLCQVPEPTMLARIARVCYAARNAVNEYLTRQWHRQLSSLFDDAHAFRALQARLGFLVGRYQQATQLPPHLYEAHGGRLVTWTHSGLDTIQLIISADAAHEGEMSEWLRNQGYNISSNGTVNSRMLIDIHKTFAGVKGDFPNDDGDMFGSEPSTSSLAVKADHTVLVLWGPSSGPKVSNLLAPLLCGSQILDVFSWRTCWTPYPRTKYEIPELHRDFCRSTEMAAERALKCVRDHSSILREFFRARWLGDRTSWVVYLTTEGLDEILAQSNSTACDDSHWAINGWMMFNGPGPDGENDFIRRVASSMPGQGYKAPKFASFSSVDPRFRFPIPRWEYLDRDLDGDEGSKTGMPIVEFPTHEVLLPSPRVMIRIKRGYIAPAAFYDLVKRATSASSLVVVLADGSNDAMLRTWIGTIQQWMQSTERELFLCLNAIVRESKPQAELPPANSRRAVAAQRGSERRPRMHQVLAKLDKMKIETREDIED